MHARALTAAITAMITIAALTPVAAAAPTENQPVVPVDDLTARPAAVDAGAGASWGMGSEVVRQSSGPPALARQLARVLPDAAADARRHHRRTGPAAATASAARGSVPGGHGPWHRWCGPSRSRGNELLFVQVVAFATTPPGPACARHLVPPEPPRLPPLPHRRLHVREPPHPPTDVRLGDCAPGIPHPRHLRTTPPFGRLHVAERATVAYRDGRYLLLASSTGVLEFIGDTPKPNFDRWADSIEYMYDRAARLPAPTPRSTGVSRHGTAARHGPIATFRPLILSPD